MDNMQIVSKVIIRVSLLDSPPNWLVEELKNVYIKSEIKKAFKRYWHFRENPLELETIIEKYIKPKYEKMKKFYKPGTITRRGTSIDLSLNPSEEDIRKEAEKLMESFKKPPDIKELGPKLEHGANKYADKRLQTIPLKGYMDKIQGVGPLASRWLLGDEAVLKFISRKDIEVGRQVDVVKPEMRGRFRQKLTGLIVSTGRSAIISIRTKYHNQVMKEVNRTLNVFMNEYAREEFGSFGTGESSIEWVVTDGVPCLVITIAMTP